MCSYCISTVVENRSTIRIYECGRANKGIHRSYRKPRNLSQLVAKVGDDFRS